VFGYDCSHKLHFLADELPENAWKTLPRHTVKTTARRKPPRRRQAIIEQRQFRDLRLIVRLLAWNQWQPTFWRLTEAVETPLRCEHWPDCGAERPDCAA
jgi:hypothetical protein